MLWREARASRLRSKLEEIAGHLAALDDASKLQMSLYLSATARHAREEFGPLDNLSADEKVDIAKKLRLLGKEISHRNIGQRHAYFILSALYESQTLLGENATFVRTMCDEYILAALEVEKKFL
jgi:hypothetical protein